MKKNNLVALSPYVRQINSRTSESIHLMNHLTSSVKKINISTWKYLKQCVYPMPLHVIKDEIGDENLNYLLLHDILFPYESIWKIHRARFIEIETSNYCNFHCAYCPNSIFASPKKSMSSELFEEIIKKSIEYQYVRFISLHGYNEPTIDPDFMNRIYIVKKYGLKLVLYTNGSGLTTDTLKQLKHTDIVRNIVFNLPSVNPKTYFKITGSNMLPHVLHIIQEANKLHFKINISVQGTKQEQESELPGIMQRFPNTAVKTVPSFDRGGILKNQYDNHINIQSPFLNGCGFILTDIHIDVNGNFYMCMEDYHKKFIYGNIRDGKISDIMESEKIVDLRKQVWGNKPAVDDLICRKCVLMRMP